MYKLLWECWQKACRVTYLKLKGEQADAIRHCTSRCVQLSRCIAYRKVCIVSWIGEMNFVYTRRSFKKNRFVTTCCTARIMLPHVINFIPTSSFASRKFNVNHRRSNHN